MAAIQLFGWELRKAEDEVTQTKPAIAPPQTDDGAYVINSSALGGYYGTYLNLDAAFRNENELISRYRTMAMQPELESAIDEIVNEAIVHDDRGMSVEMMTDDLPQPDNIKQILRDEFKQILRLLDFDNSGHDIFRRWYIDGRLFYQVQIDETNPKAGITGLVYLDPRKVRKVRSVIKNKDPRTGIEIVAGYQDFYVYNEKGSVPTPNMVLTSPVDAAIKIAEDAVVNINSGLMDVSRNIVLSYLHKAIKPLNQLRMIEDAVVIYRLSRAPERRVFYIDVGNLPKMKADQYMQDIMTKFRNKIVYDPSTGEIKDDRKFTSMIEDFWIPRRGEGKSTEISTLPAGQSLGQLDDVKYFEEKLYKSLNVPISRLVPQQGFTLGRSNEITRDELKFNKFVERLRAKFCTLFDELMKRQLALKGIALPEEWEQIKEYVYYDFLEDNNFAELKDAELNATRINLLNQIQPYVGMYYSLSWVRKNVLHLSEEEVEKMEVEIEEEQAEMMRFAQLQMQMQMAAQSVMMQQQGNINNQGEPSPSGAEQQ
jgi:hypothetical protein